MDENFLSIMPFDILDKIIYMNNLSTILELRKTNKYYKTYIDNVLHNNYVLINQFNPSIFIDIPASHVIKQQLNMKQFLYMLIDSEHRIPDVNILWSDFPRNIEKNFGKVKYEDKDHIIKYQTLKYRFTQLYDGIIIDFRNSLKDINGTLLPSEIMYYPNMNIQSYMYRVNMLYHNPDGPAIITFYQDGQLRLEAYYNYGKEHNTQGPATLEYYEDGQLYSKMYYINGMIHNTEGPASFKYYENGELRLKVYYINDMKHNTEGPAMIEYYETGQIKEENYFINNVMHNPNGPALIKYYETGEIKKEQYYIDDLFHNDEGSVIIQYYENGQIKNKNYYIRDKLHNDK